MREWPFPFADNAAPAALRRMLTRLAVIAVGVHALGLLVAASTGTFVTIPNKDHTPAMYQVLERGYPGSINVPPGFSYYLAVKYTVTAALGLPYWTGKILFDTWLVLVAAVLSSLLAYALTRNVRMAFLGGAGLVAAPIFILGVGMEEAAILFIVPFLSSLLLFARELQREAGVRYRMMFLAGLLMGCATLIRANSQFIVLALVLVTAAAQAHHGTRRVLIVVLFTFVAFTAGQALAMLPWTLVQRSLGKEGLAAMPTAYQSYFDGFKRNKGNRIADELLADYDAPERSLRGIIDFNTHWLREDPVAFTTLYARKFARAWYMSDTGRWDIPTLLLHLPWWVGAITGLWLWRRRRKSIGASRDPALWMLLLVIGYMWTISAVMAGIARYSAPLYGMISLLAAPAVIPIWDRLMSRLRHTARA